MGKYASSRESWRHAKAIRKYGADVCVKAYRMNCEQGEGATMISICCGLHYNSVAAAIAAGREIAGRA
jgi:hypothetical protein